MVDLGLLVKSHRKKAGLTQLQLANLAGIGKTTVFDIEKNKETVRWEQHSCRAPGIEHRSGI